MNTKRYVSQKDLAEELKVSISTISRALKNSPEVGLELRKRVKALAKKRNYRPNPFARSLVGNAPRIIGIIVPEIVLHFYSSAISGIEDVARKNNYSVIITSSYEQYELEKQNVEDLVNIRVEGIVGCLSQETKDYSHFEVLAEQNIPLVFFDRVCLTNKFSSVVTDNVEAAQKATQHLIQGGSKRIGFLGGANHLDIVRQRKHGYLQTLREHKIAIDKHLVLCKKIGSNNGYEDTCKLLALSNPPDAILATIDSIAFGAMKAIKEHNLRIPEDIALIGYTDEIYYDYVEPALTTVTHQTYKMGEVACKLLFKQIEHGGKPQQIVIPAHLTIRDSSIKKKR